MYYTITNNSIGTQYSHTEELAESQNDIRNIGSYC